MGMEFLLTPLPLLSLPFPPRANERNKCPGLCKVVEDEVGGILILPQEMRLSAYGSAPNLKKRILHKSRTIEMAESYPTFKR